MDKIGISYRSETNNYADLTNTICDRDFKLFKANKITKIDLWLYWNHIEPTKGNWTAGDKVLTEIRRICERAGLAGLDVNICVMTMFKNTTTGVPSWCQDSQNGNARSMMAILHDADDQQAFVDMIAHVVQNLRDVSQITTWNPINEPNQNTNLTVSEVEAMLKLFVRLHRTCKAYDGRDTLGPRMGPTKFIELWNWDPRIFTFDIFGITYYGEIDNPLLTQIRTKCDSLRKQFWICEAGSLKTIDTEQVTEIRAMANYYNALKMDCVMYVTWHTLNPQAGRGYSLNKDTLGNPRPAFYELDYGGGTPQYVYNFFVSSESGQPLVATVKAGEYTAITELGSGFAQIISSMPLDGLPFTVDSTGYKTYKGTVQASNNVVMGTTPPPPPEGSLTITAVKDDSPIVASFEITGGSA